MSSFNAKAELFDSQGCQLVGILHTADASVGTGVIMLVGGPQYRVGAHRMFVDIAGILSASGIPTFRFDHRGMGDSEGQFPGFENLDDDIDAAITVLLQRCSDVTDVVLLGLCDGATAAALYSPGDLRICAKLLLNPWVHSKTGEAKAYLSYYYPRRMLQKTFWTSLFRGRVRILRGLRDLTAQVLHVTKRRNGEAPVAGQGYRERMRENLGNFAGHVQVVLSEHDMTAVEFRDLITGDDAWLEVLHANSVVDLPGADHTLSDSAILTDFAQTVSDWIFSFRK